jgi:hypothetical protein
MAVRKKRKVTPYGDLNKGGQKRFRMLLRKKLLKLWSLKVRTRDKTCYLCGGSEHLNAHHVFPKKMYPSLRYDIKNGITVCASCHMFKGRTNMGSFHNSPIPNVYYANAKPTIWKYLNSKCLDKIDLDDYKILTDYENKLT